MTDITIEYASVCLVKFPHATLRRLAGLSAGYEVAEIKHEGNTLVIRFVEKGETKTCAL